MIFTTSFSGWIRGSWIDPPWLILVAGLRHPGLVGQPQLHRALMVVFFCPANHPLEPLQSPGLAGYPGAQSETVLHTGSHCFTGGSPAACHRIRWRGSSGCRSSLRSVVSEKNSSHTAEKEPRSGGEERGGQSGDTGAATETATANAAAVGAVAAGQSGDRAGAGESGRCSQAEKVSGERGWECGGPGAGRGLSVETEERTTAEGDTPTTGRCIGVGEVDGRRVATNLRYTV